MRKCYKLITFINLLLMLSVFIDINIFPNDSNPICKTKKIWSIKGPIPQKLINRKNTLLKAISSSNIRKRFTALDKFRKIAPYFLSYLKKNFSQLSLWQRHYLKYYFLDNMTNVSDIRIMCSQGNKFMWYLILGNYFLVIGDEKGIVDSFSLIKLPQGRWQIEGIVCNIQNIGQKKFAITLSSTAGNITPLEGTLVLTHNGVYKNAKIVPNNQHDDFALIVKPRYNKAMVIYNNIKSEMYDDVLNISFGYNNTRFGFIAKKNDKNVVVIDGEEKGMYDDVCNKSYNAIIFSKDESRYAYFVKQDGKCIAVVNGKTSKKYDDILEFGFSPNNERFYFITKNKNKYSVVVDWQESREYEYIERFFFSRNSQRFIYKAKMENKWVVVVDGIESEGYEDIISVDFTPDGKKFWYVATESVSKKLFKHKIKVKKFVVVIDGAKSQMYDTLVQSPQVSSDSSKLWFVGKNKNKMHFVLNGKQQKGYDNILNVVFNENMDSYYYFAKVGRKMVVVVNGNPSKRYDNITNFEYIPNNKGYYFFARKSGKWMVIVNNVESRKYDKITGFILSPDNRRFAFMGRRKNRWVIVLDGKEIKSNGEIFDFAFSNDGAKFIYVIKDKATYKAIIDGTYYDISAIDWFIYSHGDKKFTYVKRKGRKELTVSYKYTKDKNKEEDLIEQKFKEYRIRDKRIKEIIAASSYSKTNDHIYIMDDGKVLFLGWRSGNLYKIICK